MPEPLPELPAETWRNLRFEWLWVYRADAATAGRWSPFGEVPCGVFFIENGWIEVETAGRKFRVGRGEAFFSAPGPRRHYFHPGTRLLSVGFRCLRPDGLSVYGKGLNLLVPTARLAAFRSATLRLYEAVHGGRAVGYHRSILPRAASLADRAAHESAFLAWFADYARTLARLGVRPEPGHRGGRQLDAILEVLNELPPGRRLDWAALSERTGYGRRRLDQLLRAGLGLTVKGFLEQRRLEAARRLLREAGRPLKEVALTLGFRQPSHFTAWFKAGAGRTPSGFRVDARQF